jgi:intracellular sulfur oxidation DsrE/DsrF family protein
VRDHTAEADPMNKESRQDAVARRTFLSRLTAAAAAFGATFGSVSGAEAHGPQAPAAASGPWQPTRHPEDDWFDDPTAKHRFFMDTTTSDGLGLAMAFARNFFEANASGYRLADADTAQIICLRHRSTPFAFTDAMWAKYSATLSERADNVLDPKTKQVPTVNLYEMPGSGGALKSGGVTLTALAKRGVRYAVCAMATRRAATLIAEKTGAKVDDVFNELTQHLVPNAHMVAAGIVAVNRAQERGYTSSTVV